MMLASVFVEGLNGRIQIRHCRFPEVAERFKDHSKPERLRTLLTITSAISYSPLFLPNKGITIAENESPQLSIQDKTVASGVHCLERNHS